MTKEIQLKLKNNPKYLEYLRTHSYWYKDLNRSANNYKRFEEEVKVNYKLRFPDKVEKTINMLDMLQTILGTLNQR